MTVVRRALLLVIVVAGCGGGGDADRARKTRLDEIDRRLASLEKQLESIAELTKRLQDLEQRVAAAEARVAQRRPAEMAAPAPVPPPQGGSASALPGTPGGAAQPWASLHGPGGGSRRAALMALGEEYKVRIGRVREQYGAAAGSPEGQQALEEVEQWYQEHLRALMEQDWAGGSAQQAPSK